MSRRLRVLVLCITAVVLLGGSTAYVLLSRSAQQQAIATATPQRTAAAAAVASGPRIVFRNTAIGPNYGHVAMVPLSAPAGGRAFTDESCDRVFATAQKTLCLGSDRGVVTTYTAKVYGHGDSPPVQIPLTGIPSRARLSADGRLAATTSFVSGDSYAAAGFSTRTVVASLTDHWTQDLESATLMHAGTRVMPTDRNYWGVTFGPDGDSFFVTVAFGGATHLAKGKLSTRTIETLRADAECPSLSPDGTHVAYKKLGDRAQGDWRIAVLDLVSGTEKTLAESRSVDDQVEWLDNDTVIYGLPKEGSDAARSDVWKVPADGTGKPSILIEEAWSPAVIR